MSPLRLNGSTSGYAELAASAAAGDVILTLPSTAGTLDRTNRAGNILQVVMGTKNTNTTTSSTSYVDTGLSASITPSSASNSILVLVSQFVFMAGSSQSMTADLSIVRGSTLVRESRVVETYDQGGSGVEAGTIIAFNYLDAPSSTSSVTYKTQGKKSGATGSEVRFREGGVIILMEVAA